MLKERIKKLILRLISHIPKAEKLLRRVFHKEQEVERWRRGGAHVGEGTKFYSASLDSCFPYLIYIGDNCVLTHCSVLAHDASMHQALGYSRVAEVRIGDNCFVGMNSTILCGTTIGDNVIIGAGAVVTGDIPSNSVAVGVPARVIGNYSDYIEENRQILAGNNVFVSDVLFSEKSQKDKEKLMNALKDGKTGFDL